MLIQKYFLTQPASKPALHSEPLRQCLQLTCQLRLAIGDLGNFPRAVEGLQ